MTPIEQITFEIVKQLQDECVASHRAPVNVSIHEIQKEIMKRVKTALNTFVKNGNLEWHNNVNGIAMFTILKNPE